MRLNWNNLGRGLEGIAAAKQAQDLARESARYDVTEGAYGPGLQENITQLEGLRANVADPAQNTYDPQKLASYDQAIVELQRRQGLTAPDYSVPGAPTNFASRQEARQAAAPLRAEGLAGVYRRYGDVEKADALETRAYEQQRALAAEERAKTAEGRAAQDFATRQTLTGLEINERTQKAAEQQRATDFAAFAAENPNATTAELKDAAFKQFKFSPKQWQEAVNTRLGIKENEQKEFVLGIKDKLKGKNLQQLGSLYNTDPDFDDKTDLAIVPGKGGAVTLNFIDKATGRVTSSQSFKNEAIATEYLNKQATEPETIGSWMMNLREKEVGIASKEADIGLKRAQTASAAQEKLSPLEKNLAALQRLGVKVSPEEIKGMAGIKAPALSQEAAAQIEIITASLKDNSTPANIEAARAAVTDIFKGEGLKQRNTVIVSGLRTAAGKNDLPAAIKQLQDAGVGTETIIGLARQAGVQLPANFAPTPAPASAPAAPTRSVGLASQPTSQQKYGLLTPMSTIEADARAGNPDAIAYLDYLRGRERVRDENARSALE